MKQFLSGLLFIAVATFGISTTVFAQVPSVIVAPITATCQGTNTVLRYSATNSPNSYSITWFGSPAGLPNVPPGTFLPTGSIPITVLSSAVPGTYYGTLVISNTAGGSSPTAINVTVYGNPHMYTVTGGGSYCNGTGGIDLGLSSSEVGVLYQMYHMGSASGTSIWGTGAPLDFGYKTLSGSYTIVGTNAYTGCVSNMSGTANISINPVPTGVSVTGGGGYCAGGTGLNVGLAASVFGTYYQLFNDTTAVGGPVAGIGMALDFGPQTTPGTYTVLAIDSAGPCTSQMTGSASIYIYPNPTIYDVAGGGSYCYGGYGVDVRLTGSNTGVNYKLYNNGTVLMSTLAGTGGPIDFGRQTPDGFYTVTAINQVYTCTEPMADTAYISYIPDSTPVVSIATQQTVCQGTIDTFRAIAINGGTAPQYTWTLNGAFVAYGNTYIYTPNNSDIVKVSMTSNVTCAVPSAVSASLNMTVKPDIIPTVVLTARTTIINGSTDNLSVAAINGGVNPVYQWLVNGVIVAGANTLNFSSNAFKDGDSVTALVYGCADTPGHASAIIHVIPRESVAQISGSDANVQIIPNPNKGTFSLSGTVSDDIVSVKIADMMGREIYSNILTASNGQISARITLPSSLPSGMYLMQVHSGDTNEMLKFIIE